MAPTRGPLASLLVTTSLLLTPCVRAPAQQPGGGRDRNLSAKGGEAGGANRPRPAREDYATARQKLLDAAKTPEGGAPVDPASLDVKDFGALVTAAADEASNRKLPSVNDSPENNYTPEHLAFRKEVYGPVRDDPVLREFLRTLVRKAATGFDFNGTTAALVLADDPDAADLDAIFTGYGATIPENRTPLARQLGRALGAARTQEPRPPRFDEMVERVKADAAEGKAVQRGAALEALYRAGESELALQHLKKLLSQATEPLEAVTVLQACSRLLQQTDVDPFLRSRAVAVAHAAVESILSDTSALKASQSIGGDGRILRAATSFLQDVGGAREMDLVLRCLSEPRAQQLLGMDGLQNVRYGLSRARPTMADDQGAKVDEWFLKLLLETGNRLFSLEEEPMTQEEKRAFWDARDLRYNAIAYFIDQIRRTKAVKERLYQEKDLPELLVTIFKAKEDVKDVRDGETVWRGVAEKLENRASALELLANLEREFNKPTPGIDLFSEGLAVLCAEVQAPPIRPAEIIAFRKAYAPGAMFEFPVGKEPADEFVKRTGCMVIATLGYIVHTGDGKVGIEVDAANPWPWERDGKPPLEPVKPGAAKPEEEKDGAVDPPKPPQGKDDEKDGD
ncbi:MAG TPA: hypothetical protein VFG37_08615 [Planctomycetota bacterium]|nr:hypothetical protein [Planctomycetota bacterium]